MSLILVFCALFRLLMFIALCGLILRCRVQFTLPR